MEKNFHNKVSICFGKTEPIENKDNKKGVVFASINYINKIFSFRRAEHMESISSRIFSEFLQKARVFLPGLIMVVLSIAAAGSVCADVGQWRAAPGLSCQGNIAGLYSGTGGSLVMSAVESANTDIIKIHYAVPEPIFETLSVQEINGVNTQRCILGNAELVGEPGEPLIPMIRSRVILPKGRTVGSINISPVESVELDGEYLLAYATKPHPLSSTKIEPTFASDEIYGSDDTFPNKDYTLVSIQDRCGVSIAIIECYPLSYNPLSGSVEYYKEYILEVETTSVQQLKANNAIKARPDRILGGIQSEENPETLESYTDLQDLAETDVYAGEYSYVIVTGNDIINASTTPNLNDFVAHKQSLGFSVKVEAIEDILATQSGSSNSDKLRNYLRDAYNNWNTKFVLLGGDTNIIPLKTVYASFGGVSDDLPSDLPYQCLSQTSWDDDFEAEVFIGRASAENAAEFSNFVYKTIAFENTSQSDSYIKTVLNLGEQLDSSTYAKPAMEVIKAKFSSDYTINTLYDQDSTWSKYDFVTKVNQNKYSIMNHLGHSNAQYAMKNYISDLQNNPMNNNKYIFVKSQGCIPGAFDQSCMAEYMTTANRNGMWGVVFNSRYGWYSPSNVTNGSSQVVHASFWNAYFSNNLKSVGECNEYSHRVNTNYRWDILESNLFGDPSVVFGGNSGPNTYPLTVTNGSGDGSYAAGTSVGITADSPPSGKAFDKWVINSGNPSIANIYSSSTTLTMPASSASVEATYKDDGGGGGGDYCTSSGDNNSYEWIAGVHIGSMSNTSGASGYSDFTSQTLSVSANDTVSVSLTPGFSGSSYTESWKIWIDYNLDGDFEDSGEEVLSKSGSSTVSGSFTVPGSASGETRMRVSMSYGSAPPYCGTFSYGEVEDYTVDIGGGVQTYTLNVISGSGDGSYEAGENVTITANGAPSGQVFDKWVVNSGSPQIADVNASGTTLTMPAGNVTVTATYKVSGGGPEGYTWCASENQSYTFAETVDVAYGANGQFYYKYGVTGTITFNNATFGDPVPGVVKAGYYKSSGGGGAGTITRQVWTGISGATIAALTGNSNYPDNPSSTDELGSFEAPTNWADNYGTRIVGYLHAPVTGTYTFWIASDDNGELWLSTDDSAGNKVRIAYVPGWSSSRQWTKFAEQKSAGVNLTAGQHYYIEALQKEAAGGDNLAVAWQIPGGTQEVIPGDYLSPYDGAGGIEIDSITINQPNSTTWHQVGFDKAFSETPIVVMGPLSYNGGDPTTVRVRNITVAGFEFQFDEWDYKDGSHTTETLSYMAMTPGTHQWGGMTVTAGSIDNVDHQWKTVNYAQGFSSTPVVLAQQVSNNDGQATAVRLKNISPTSFAIALQEEELNRDTDGGVHAYEQVNYVAVTQGTGSADDYTIEAGLTGKSVTDAWYQVDFGDIFVEPYFLASMQSYNGPDTATLRYQGLAETGVQVKVEEEESKDSETGHTSEVAGWIVVTPF